MTDKLKESFLLGDWLVEPDLNRISKHGVATHLEPKAMDVLCYLAARPDSLVTAEEIISDVWGGRPMGDNPVYKAIAKLRRALDDDSDQPRYIDTVPKKGYRLIVPVVAPAVADSPPGRGPARRAWRRFVPVVVGVAVGVLTAVVLFWKPDYEAPTIRLVTAFAGSQTEPSYSPDGSKFAFVSEIDGYAQTWIGDFEGRVPRQLTFGDYPCVRPRWSPGGEAVICMSYASVWSVPEAGGEPVRLIRDAANPNFSADGRHIVFERRYQIWVADADGGDQRRVSSIAERELPLSYRWPAFAPDGERIVYFESDYTPLGDLWITDLDGGIPERLTMSPAIGSAPVWSRDGRFIVYSTQRGGSRTLWRVEVASKKAEALLVGSGDDDFPDISPDSDRIIYSNTRQRMYLVASHPESKSERILHESRGLLVGPSLSPDRNTIAFAGEASTGSFQIFTVPVAGGLPTLLTHNPLDANALPQWTGDSDHLNFFHARSYSAFARVAAAGGEVEILVPDWNWDTANGASMSPDGRTIIYSRLTGQVPVQTLLRDVQTGEDRTFYATLEYPRWSADGENVIGSYYVDQRFPGDVAICPIAGNECRIVAEGGRIPMWSHDETEVYFVRGFGFSQSLYAVSVDGTNERYVMDMAPLHPLASFYDVARSGEIIWTRHEKERSELWEAEL
jgi:Tol biopolymer transport system component/DNA-binding winged helix-turn-helix (wHTH) protein